MRWQDEALGILRSRNTNFVDLAEFNGCNVKFIEKIFNEDMNKSIAEFLEAFVGKSFKHWMKYSVR
jgi:hypothetical protein